MYSFLWLGPGDLCTAVNHITVIQGNLGEKENRHCKSREAVNRDTVDISLHMICGTFSKERK